MIRTSEMSVECLFSITPCLGRLQARRHRRLVARSRVLPRAVQPSDAAAGAPPHGLLCADPQLPPRRLRVGNKTDLPVQTYSGA